METLHPIELLINQADQAINAEDFDMLVDIYAPDALLVIKPGMNAVGKEQIKKAFEAIAAYFEHTLEVKQAGLSILETGDTALVLAKTLVCAKDIPTMERKATYVFTKNADNLWKCSIDNSYGHDLIQ
ncbi:SgcJ/EcaC family oxidoreductase [Sulfurospirillum diekertiae]|uniref:SgcJ/EcaC family oxidoreductase n=1 Tax=Sulfurospirillum diekertiae TaxID=1854492 RepID=A0A6G9VR12_9BACT|nr:SgcJ/EcaC family oxidoreductase [Sulfurospirillum diekertiae]QIR75065.1 SgcJ/EcaC family oxidoreductase [Sulfurospirillum diekertiae]QIR77728.1 SgcJ/EcaC family oxidoreductase [Sulfurospirillum diekertiae]